MNFKWELGIALDVLQIIWASSHVDGGNLLVFLNCRGKLKISLELRQDPQGTFHVASGKSGLRASCKGWLWILSNRCRGIGSHLEFRRETQGSFPVTSGISGFLSSFNRGVRPRLMLKYGTPLSSRVLKGVAGLSSSGRELGIFLEVQQGSQTSLHVVRGYSGFHSSQYRVQGNQALSCV